MAFTLEIKFRGNEHILVKICCLNCQLCLLNLMLTFNFTFIQDTFLVTWLCCLMFFFCGFSAVCAATQFITTVCNLSVSSVQFGLHPMSVCLTYSVSETFYEIIVPYKSKKSKVVAKDLPKPHRPTGQCWSSFH